MQERLPFFAELEASQRASVAAGGADRRVNFVEWMHDPHSNVSYTARGLRAGAPGPDPPDRAAPDRRHGARHHGVLRRGGAAAGPLRRAADRADGGHPASYSRDLAFTAATAYADAAEARGTWDSRMEASVVDAVVRGDTGPELLSRAAALNWDTTAPATVVVGTRPPADRDPSCASERRPRHRRPARPRRAHRRARHLAGGDRVRPAVADRQVPRRSAGARSPTVRW